MFHATIIKFLSISGLQGKGAKATLEKACSVCSEKLIINCAVRD